MKTRLAKPVSGLDPEACSQLRETRATILEALGREPDDFKALLLADVLCELDPDRDATLAGWGEKFRATRPADWKLRAKELGLDRLLFHLAVGWRGAEIGLAALPVLERRAAEIGEARAAGVPTGLIDRSYVPAELVRDRRVTIAYHPGGHLAKVELLIDRHHEGRLALDELPGSGRFTLVEQRGGSGTMIREHYREGTVVTTLNTPWHDGVESSEAKPWTRWVEECLAQLERLSGQKLEPTPKRKPKRS